MKTKQDMKELSALNFHTKSSFDSKLDYVASDWKCRLKHPARHWKKNQQFTCTPFRDTLTKAPYSIPNFVTFSCRVTNLEYPKKLQMFFARQLIKECIVLRTNTERFMDVVQL